jgi:hypothetical protein
MKTKKDFIKIADELARIKDSSLREQNIQTQVQALSTSNPRFDEGRFRHFIEKRRIEGGVLDKKEGLKWSLKKKWVKTDAWRGYEEPVYAIAGVNDTGMWSDSPSPSNKTNAELQKFRAKLNELGIPTRKVTGQTSNVFAGNQFLIAPKELYPTAKQKVKELLKNKKYDWVWEV